MVLSFCPGPEAWLHRFAGLSRCDGGQMVVCMARDNAHCHAIRSCTNERIGWNETSAWCTKLALNSLFEIKFVAMLNHRVLQQLSHIEKLMTGLLAIPASFSSLLRALVEPCTA
jgi:hypothetical protein